MKFNYFYMNEKKTQGIYQRTENNNIVIKMIIFLCEE